MFRRFSKRFEYKNEAGERVTIPRGWAGELDKDVAQAADEARATVLDAKEKKASRAAAKPTEPSAELVNARKAVADAEKTLKAAKNDAEKAEAEAALDASRKALTDLET